MQRRSFVKSMAAALSTLVVGRSLAAEATVGQPINYDLFVDHYSSRYKLDRPFLLPEDCGRRNLYATDSRILITHPVADDFGIQGENNRVPNLSHLPWEAFAGRGWRPFGDFDRVADAFDCDISCEVCFGTGRVGADVRQCRKCYGQEFDCHGNWDSEHWLGGVPCTHCQKGYVNEPYSYEIGGERFLPVNVAKMRHLQAQEWRVVQFWNGGIGSARQEVLLFRFRDGGKGLLMPLMKD